MENLVPQRPRARESSPHLLPSPGVPSKRRNRNISAPFWPKDSTLTYRDATSAKPSTTPSPTVRTMKDKRDSTSGPPTPVPSSIYSVYSVTFKGNSRASGLNLVSKGSLCTHPGDQTSSADGPVRGRKSNGFLLAIPSDRELQGDGTVLSECFSGILPINTCDRALLADSSIHRQAFNGDPSAIPRDPGPPLEDSTRGHAYNRTPPIAPPDQRPRARERDLHGPKSIFHVRHAQIPPRPS